MRSNLQLRASGPHGLSLREPCLRECRGSELVSSFSPSADAISISASTSPAWCGVHDDERRNKCPSSTVLESTPVQRAGARSSGVGSVGRVFLAPGSRGLGRARPDVPEACDRQPDRGDQLEVLPLIDERPQTARERRRVRDDARTCRGRGDSEIHTERREPRPKFGECLPRSMPQSVWPRPSRCRRRTQVEGPTHELMSRTRTHPPERRVELFVRTNVTERPARRRRTTAEGHRRAAPGRRRRRRRQPRSSSR